MDMDKFAGQECFSPAFYDIMMFRRKAKAFLNSAAGKGSHSIRLGGANGTTLFLCRGTGDYETKTGRGENVCSQMFTG